MNYNLVLILILFEVVFFSFLVFKLFNGRNLITIFYEPVIFFILGSILVYLLIPFFMILLNFKFYKFENYSLTDFFNANLICFTYIILVLIFYFLILNKLKLKNTKSFKIYFNKLKKKEIILLLILFSFIYIATLFLLKNIYIYGLKEYLDNRIIIRKGKGFLVLLSYLSLLIIPIFESHILIKVKNNEIKKIYFNLYILFVVIPFIIIYFFLGNRLPAFIIITLSLFAYWVIYLKKLNLKYLIKIILIFIILVFLFSFAGLYRLARGDLDKLNNKYVKNLYVNVFEYAIIKNFGNFEQLVWLYKHENRWEPLYGETYLAGFLNFIPRKIYPEKLLGGGPHLKNIISPGSYDLSKSNITSYTTGVVIEAFMNFKYLGIFIIAFFHSILLIFLKKFSISLNKNLILFLIYLYLLFSISFLILFSEFLGLFSKMIFLTVPFLIIYFLKDIKLVFRQT